MSSDNLIEQTTELIGQWRENPLLYLQEQLGITKIWGMQSDLLSVDVPLAIKEHKPIYLGSGHALGKDYICSAIACWFLDCYAPSTVVLTGPTDRQVKNIMWSETLSKWNNRKYNFWGKTYAAPYIEIDKARKWYLLGFTTRDSGASASSGGAKFQGIHNTNVCIIVSEAQGIEDAIYDQIDACSTGENVLVIFIGNPTNIKGRFAEGLKNHKQNISRSFSCLQNPNYLYREDRIPGLASYKWVEDKRARWGEKDPRWISRVLGQVPDTSINVLYDSITMGLAKSRHGFLARFSFNRGVAVDSAGEGIDDNVFMSGSGGEVKEVYTTATIAPSLAAIKAVEMCKAIDGHFIIVDCDGIGIGVWQELTKLPPEYMKGIEVIKFHGSSSGTKVVTMADGKEKKIYKNKRAEAAFLGKERITRGHAAVNEQDLELIEDLEQDEWFENDRGELQLIDKADIKEALGRSPGRGDCWKMLQWAFELETKDNRYETNRPGQMYAETGEDVKMLQSQAGAD